jgi:hypothetical protein
MAEQRWLGGAAATTQVDTLTIALTWAAADTMTTTLTAEDGTTSTVNTVVAGSDNEANRDAHLADLQAVQTGGTIWDTVTFASSSTDKITVTANVSGTPFYCTASETTAGNGTWARASTTANTGPNDWETTGNWSSASVPVNNDDVKFLTGRHPLLFGLRPGNGAGNQGGASLSLTTFRVAEAYDGVSIGQPANSYYLDLDATTVSIDNKNAQVLLDGTHTDVAIKGTTAGTKAVQLDGDIGSLYLTGPDVIGKVWVADSAVLDNIYVNDCPNAELEVGENVTSLDILQATAGRIVMNSGGASLVVDVAGTATVIYHGDADEAVSAWTSFGGVSEYNGSGTLTTAILHSGTFSLENSEAESVTITNCTVYGGFWTDESGLKNVTYTNNIIKWGGSVNSETGTTIAYT